MKKADLEKRIKDLAKSHDVEWLYLGGTKHDKYSLNGTVILKDCHKALDDLDD